MAIQTTITPELLRQLIRYEAESGNLYWLPRSASYFPDGGNGGRVANMTRWNGQYAGKLALNASAKTGRKAGHLFDRPLAAHRVAWAIYYGSWPNGDIDHIDGDPSNNRIANLRDVSHGENMKNRSLQTNNLSGVSGVSWNKMRNRWEAYVKIEGKRIALGFWQTIEEARAARYGALKVGGFSERHGKHSSAYRA